MEEIRALGKLPQDVTGASAALGVCVSSQQLVTCVQMTLLNSPPQAEAIGPCAGSEQSLDLLDPSEDGAENRLDQKNMLMMCNRIQSRARL